MKGTNIVRILNFTTNSSLSIFFGYCFYCSVGLTYDAFKSIGDLFDTGYIDTIPFIVFSILTGISSFLTLKIALISFENPRNTEGVK